MPTTRQRIWAIICILVFALTVGTFGFAAQDLDVGLMMLVLIPGSIIIMTLFAIVSGMVAWLYRPFRRFFFPVNLGLLLLLMLAWSGYFYERTKFPEEFEQVKAYVAIASPSLESYYQQHGHFPIPWTNSACRRPLPLVWIINTFYITTTIGRRHVTRTTEANSIPWISVRPIYALTEIGLWMTKLALQPPSRAVQRLNLPNHSRIFSGSMPLTRHQSA